MVKTPAGYKVGKRSKRAVFDLRDMLIAVEDAEDEALHTEKIAIEKKRNRERKKLDINIIKSDNLTEIILQRHFTLSTELKIKWAKSLNTVPSKSTENKDVYPKIIKELDELYSSRLEKRIAEIQSQYNQKSDQERNIRLQKVQNARQQAEEEAEKLRETARTREKEDERLKAIEQQKLEHDRKVQEDLRAEEEGRRQREQIEMEKIKSQQQEPEPTSIPAVSFDKPLEQVATPVVQSNHVGSLDDPRYACLTNKAVIEAEITKWEEKCETLLRPVADGDKDVAMKIARAIAVPVGALTQRSGQDLKTQVAKIANLLSAKDLPQHPLTAEFVVVTISKRLVRLAEEQLSSNEQAACATAAAIIALWLQRPEFGQLFMAHLFSACPILLPNTTSSHDEADEQKMRTFSGLTRLFAALASSNCPPGTKQHPFGLENVWKTIVAILILPNATELTSQVLYEILRYAGRKLRENYTKQFAKLDTYESGYKIKNREAARECRRKKKEYIKCLENRVQVLENQNKALIEELHKLKQQYESSAENDQMMRAEQVALAQAHIAHMARQSQHFTHFS